MITEEIKSAGVSEIFSSLQGEGPHIGEPHIFLRFEHCNIHCAYCDELGKPAVSMSVQDVSRTVRDLERTEGPHRFISLTGGEPLLYVDFLEPLMSELEAGGFRFYLETSGILYKALARVIDRTDTVAMDIKLMSITKEPKNYFDEHRAFLRLARRAREVFVKMIVSPEVDREEFLTGVKIIEAENASIPLVIQGVTGHGVDDALQNETLRQLQKLALKYLPDVRIIPRLHVAMGIR